MPPTIRTTPLDDRRMEIWFKNCPANETVGTQQQYAKQPRRKEKERKNLGIG